MALHQVWWVTGSLDENTGTSTADSSGTGNAGTLAAGAGWAQKHAGKDYGEKAEMKANSFTVGVAWKLQLSETVIQNFCKDSKFGHKPPSSNPYKKLGKKK